MKKSIGIFVLLSAFFCLLIAGAASAADEKVGAIDPQQILFQHPKYEQTLKQIQSTAEKKEKDAKGAIDKESDNAKKQQIYQNLVREISEEERKLMKPLFDEIDIAIRTIATNKGITVVVDKSALFMGGVDITDDVVQELKKQSVSK